MKTNVLIVSTAAEGKGGVSSVVSMQMRAMERQCNIYHLTSQRRGSKFTKLFIMFKSLLSLPLILVSKNIDLVHIHGSMRSSFLRKAPFMIISKLFGKKVVHHMHSAKVNEYFGSCSKIKAKIVCFFMDQYDAMIVLGNYWRTVIGKKTSTNIFPVFNAVEKQQLPKVCKNNQFTIFVIGELGKRKGTYDILKIAKQLSAYDDIDFRIAGGGADFDKLKSICASENLNSVITWLGWVGPEERDQELANADLFFLPSYHEGMPMAILEAMSAGLPVLSTPVGAISDCVVDGKTGFLVEPGDIEHFAQKILYLKENPKLLAEFKKASSIRADTVFSPELFSDNVIQVYKTVLAN